MAQKERATRVKGLSRCLRAALGFLGATGRCFGATGRQTFAESADHWLAVAEDDDYWSEEELDLSPHTPGHDRVRGESSALLNLLTNTKHIERAFFGVQLVSDATFRQRAARLLVQKPPPPGPPGSSPPRLPWVPCALVDRAGPRSRGGRGSLTVLQDSVAARGELRESQPLSPSLVCRAAVAG